MVYALSAGISQGDAVDGFYIVVSGECAVRASRCRGEEATEIAQLGPGDFFGETGLLEGRAARNTDVVCKTPVEVIMIGNDMFLNLTTSPNASAAGAAIGTPGAMRNMLAWCHLIVLPLVAPLQVDACGREQRLDSVPGLPVQLR